MGYVKVQLNIIVIDFQVIHKLLQLSLPITITGITIPAIQPDAHIRSSLFGIVGEVLLGGVAVQKRNINHISVSWWDNHLTYMYFELIWIR